MRTPISTIAEKALEAAGIDFRSDVTTKSLRMINRIFRDADESNLWPINGRFSATDRAVRRYRRVYFAANGHCSNLEYIYGLDAEISRIVNSL